MDFVVDSHQVKKKVIKLVINSLVKNKIRPKNDGQHKWTVNEWSGAHKEWIQSRGPKFKKWQQFQ